MGISSCMCIYIYNFPILRKFLPFKYVNPAFQCFFVVKLLSCAWPLFATPWTAAHQASLSLTVSCSLPKFVIIELVMLTTHLILCRLLLLLPSVFPSIRVFCSDLAVHIRWLKYFNFRMPKICFSYLTIFHS